MEQPWKNRIIGHEEVAPDQLLANPKNWRIHPKYQQDTLSNVLNDIGIIQSIIVNAATGFVVDGHLRVALALRENQPLVPVVYVDLTEEEENRAIAMFDTITALALPDKDKIADLLESVKRDSDQKLLNAMSTHALRVNFEPVNLDEKTAFLEKFLSNDSTDDDNDDDTAVKPEDAFGKDWRGKMEETFLLEFPVTESERSIIMTGIKKLKDEHKFERTSEVLVWLISQA